MATPPDLPDEKHGKYRLKSDFFNKPVTCPQCKEFQDGFTGIDESEPGTPMHPTPGAIIVCAYCQSVNQFQEDGSLDFAPEDWRDHVHPDAIKIIDDMRQRAFKNPNW